MMDSALKMVSWWCDKRPGAGLFVVLWGMLVLPLVCVAQEVTPQERADMIRMRVAQGGTADEVDELIRAANGIAAKGLPSEPVTNKIREGLAKGVEPKRIEPVLRQLTRQLETADQLVTELEVVRSGSSRGGAVMAMADALMRGVTPEEVRDLHRQGRSSGQPLTPDALTSAAKSLSMLKEATIAPTQSVAVVGEAMRQGYRANELLELGRELKRRGGEFQSGRADLQSVREQIAKGDRPERLFREDHGGHGGNGRGETRLEWSDRSGSGRTDHIERPERSIRPDRPERLERPERPERSGGRDH